MIAINPGYFFRPKFSLGQCVATPSALEALEASGEPANQFLRRHVGGDWGDVCEEDKALNNQALVDGSRILSAYQTSAGVKIWVITEAMGDTGERASTCILTPEEY